MLLYVVVAIVLVYIGHWYLSVRRRLIQLMKLPGQHPTILTQLRSAIKYSARKNKHNAGVNFLKSIQKQNELSRQQGLNVFWVGITPLVHVFSPELTKIVLNGSGAFNRTFDYTVVEKWFGHGLFTCSGSDWRTRRNLLNPCFSRCFLENVLFETEKQARLLVAKIDEQRQGVDDHIDVWPLVKLCALDTVCGTVLGFHCGAQKGQNLDYFAAQQKVEELCRKRILSKWLHFEFLFRLSKIGREFTNNMCVVNNFARKVVGHRMAAAVQRRGRDVDDGGRRRVPLDLLIDLHLDGANITEQDLLAETKLFLFGGQDTMAAAVTFTLYCVGLHPEVQGRLHEELDALFPNKTTTMDDVLDMKYLECVIKETLRIYPPGIPGRKPDKDIEHNGIVIPSGTDVYLNLTSLHRNPDVFPDPEVFDPDRFLPENSATRHPYAYIPFAAGPRNCIGQKFGMLEMKVIVSNVLRRFQVVSLDPQVPVKLEITFKPAQPVRLKFIPRTPP